MGANGLIIDIIDCVTGIGNMREIHVALKSMKIDKISLKMAKNDAFSNIFDNIYGAQARRT